MRLVIPLNRIGDKDRQWVGGKASALAGMVHQGLNVPDGLCVTVEAYRRYVSLTGLRERILLELNRKDFHEMRWEELWDASLRIRNMFLTTTIPDALLSGLSREIEKRFGDEPVVVRSSAPGEDSTRTSFAGLHESFVNVRGVGSVIDHVRLVWASLWSDAALLYRQELGLDIARSTMAVVIQEIMVGECSGVAFAQNPIDENQAVIEAVYGLNQGLVDGTVEPDRWILDRRSGEIVVRTPAVRTGMMALSPEGVRLEPLPANKTAVPPLRDAEVRDVYLLARQAEALFGGPQDVEWTFVEGRLYVLQSRPITTTADRDKDDMRPWYLSLRRSFENLKALRTTIEGELIPRMKEAGARLAAMPLESLSDQQLADEITRRSAIHREWVDIYWDQFIPFAHGMRLFGQVYNDAVRPEDPFEFVDLLSAGPMVSVQRNRMLEEMAAMVRATPDLDDLLRQGGTDPRFDELINAFISSFGDLSCGTAQCTQGREPIIAMVMEMAAHGAPQRVDRLGRKKGLEEQFLSRFQGDQRGFAAEVLDLGRASYRLRDDDNIYLGKIEGQMLAAVEGGKRRLARRGETDMEALAPDDVAGMLKDPSYIPEDKKPEASGPSGVDFKARQLRGQPAGPGLGKGTARVVLDPSHLLDFKAGEILVCDAVDPSLTFVVPLSAGIVERRGGMLIHGAIIAREYGLPCVTGVPEATSLIKTGDQVTVDGYLGIVIVGETVGLG